ncbi:MAG: GAF domain-containing protein [Hydrogenophaga sp.]|uniref:GAF domain-containing protein n=1 Tax=Hydrogenophaga sp. TaxID=1904254 RepID=UPI001DAB7561|nr:GAF domain-containing protein [Hydrogenophaga sp.]MBX3608388.1 GAF domain-containing protein [Hydrogenophaga sp.]
MNPGDDLPAFEHADMDEVRPCFEGMVPAIMATVALDGAPNVAYLSQVYHVDDAHVALSFQFFNKTRKNLLAHPRSTVLLLHPLTGRFYRLHLNYLRTELGGPVFESMKAQLAGIASHSGMADVFVLRGADIHQVLAIERLPAEPLPLGLPEPPPRRDGLLVLRRCVQQVAQARTLDALLDASLDSIGRELGIQHAMVLILDAQAQRLYTVASRGYATSGVGSEIALGQGVIGVSARERTPVRINHLTTVMLYSQAIRQEMAAEASHEIPYPGLSQPRSQLAVPLISGDQTVGVLFVESDQEMRFTYQDEDLLVALAGQIAAGIELMRESEEPCDEAPGGPDARAVEAQAAPLRVRRYRRDDSVFVNNAYLIKGVAGAILWKLLNDHAAGRREFTNRELRLDTTLGLPDVSDNLEARLLLLHRRLNEQCPALMLQKTGRGCFRFDALAPVELDDVA